MGVAMLKRVFIISFIVLTFSSCTTSDEIAQSFINEGSRLTGLEAAEIYERGLDTIEDFSLFYNLAYSYLEAGEYDQAVKVADAALSVYPDTLRFLYLKAYAYRAEKRLYSYENTLKGILELDPGNDTIRSLLLTHYITTGRISDAENVAMEIIKYDPTNADALRALGKRNAFFAAIAPADATDNGQQDRRKWTVPPELYSPLGIFGGDRLLPEKSTVIPL